MPTKVEHTTQAEHNRKFWTSYDLNTTTFLDWVISGIFYEGVHWVEAFLDTKGEHSRVHSDRLQRMIWYKSYLDPIISDFELLKQESENARYNCHQYTQTDISNDLIPIIDKIKSHIIAII